MYIFLHILYAWFQGLLDKMDELAGGFKTLTDKYKAYINKDVEVHMYIIAED